MIFGWFGVICRWFGVILDDSCVFLCCFLKYKYAQLTFGVPTQQALVDKGPVPALGLPRPNFSSCSQPAPSTGAF